MTPRETEKEKWKIIDYRDIKPKKYAVSNFGNVKNIVNNTYLKPWKGVNGYLYVSLMRDNNKALKIGVHVLVATYFCKIPKRLQLLNQPLVPNHDDFDRTNNYYKNLTWMTYAMNNEWNRIHNHWKIGENAPNAKIDNDTVHKICKLMEDGFLNKDIMKLLGLSNSSYHKSLLTYIRNGTKWKSISSQYNIINKNTLRKNDIEFVDSICKLIESNTSVKEMRKLLNISDDVESKARFKKLVWFIRNRKCYKDVSEKYNWWK